jgi:MATE family multidrug resistance protein
MKLSIATYINDYKQIIKLGLPILVGQVGMILVGFADNIMVGRYSTAALASASFVNNLFGAAVLACIGFTYGITPLVGALFGQDRHKGIGALVRNALVLNLIYALLVSAVMAVIYFNLHRMGQPVELLPLIRPYFVLCLLGILPVSLYNVFAQWSYGIKRSKMPMWIVLAANVVNVAGNWLLIYGHCGLPELGLYGAGIATLAARWFSPILIIAIFLLKKDYAIYREGFIHGRVSAKQLWLTLRTSLPVSLQLCFETGSFSIAAVMAGWLGANELAAYQVMVTTGTLGFCCYYSMGSAASVLVANAAGRGDHRAMRRTGFASYHIILLMATVASLIFAIFGRNLISAFSTDEAVMQVALTLIPPLLLYQYADATQVNFSNALRGTSHVMPMLWIAFVSYMVIGVPATYLLGFTCRLGICGIFLSFSVSLFAAAALFLTFFLKHTKTQQ